ncbi:MAG: site-specific integrase [Anaerolineaceae bacterium]|nr:site-specific integrase [Anaerolineaceae bacterium]
MQSKMLPKFEQFIREKQYVTNVTPSTLTWYRQALRWFPCEHPAQPELLDMVVKMREKGLKATAVNSYITCFNSYLHWDSGTERSCGAGCTHPHLKRLKAPQEVMPTFTEAQVKLLVRWKPKDKYDRRVHTLILTLLDTGCRVTEALTLCVDGIDMDNLLMRLDGKGRKQRLVPFSVDLRRALYRQIKENKLEPYDRVFGTRKGTEWDRHNAIDWVKGICRELGFEPPARTLHAFGTPSP